jgi:hypothetical protein
MLEIKNRTPFEVGLFPGLDKEGYDDATVLVKGTFDLARRDRTPPVAERQAPIVHGDEFHGDPARSSIRYESDTSPAKQGTDVALVGHAYAGRRPAPAMEVSLAAGPLRKVVRVFGDRVWQRTLGAWSASSPQAFERMPLVYERAFGGTDTSDPDPARQPCEPRNPVGTGFLAEGRAARAEGLPLPNLEDPGSLLRAPGDAPAPAGFGFIGRSWAPRISFVGTYDERWRSDRCPLLPDDFDDRFHRAAHPDLAAPHHFRGGEPVIVTGASEDGEIRFDVPARAIAIAVRMKGEDHVHAAALDTILIEPDEQRVVLSWRVTFRCPRKFLYIDRITVTDGGSA